MINFEERLTNFYRYPRICLFQDKIEDSREITSFLQDPHPGQKLSYIYIHIPFCTSMCNYCPFYHTFYGHSNEDQITRFVDAIVLELKKYARQPFFQTTSIVNINFGGGTPMVLDTKHLARMLTTVFEEFNVASNPVVSMEGDPRALQDKDKLSTLKSLGLTRASFGLQTFNERLRKQLKVESDVIDVYKCVEVLDRAGIDEWGADLLYNCPEQNLAEIQFNVDRLCELGPSIVDAYDLNISPNTKLAKLVVSDYFSAAPSNRKEIEQFRAIQERFGEHDYEQVRSVNFKPPGVEIDRNGILHQFSEDVIGIGPSARTFLYSAGRNFRNHCSTQKYIEDLQADRFPVEAGNVVPPEVLEERDMMLIPYYLQVPKSSINYTRFADKIDDMVESGYMFDSEDTVGLTELGKLWAGNVQYHFHSDEEKEAIAESTFRSLQNGVNLFNQDQVNVSKHRGSTLRVTSEVQ